MNVTVVVPSALRSAVEGRPKLQLGVPPSADVGDVLQTLFQLYPKLVQHVPNEKRPVRQHLNVFVSDPAGPLARRTRATIEDGQTLYLFASAPPPPPPLPAKVKR